MSIQNSLDFSLITKPVTNSGAFSDPLIILANPIIEMEVTNIYGKIS